MSLINAIEYVLTGVHDAVMAGWAIQTTKVNMLSDSQQPELFTKAAFPNGAA